MCHMNSLDKPSPYAKPVEPVAKFLLTVGKSDLPISKKNLFSPGKLPNL